MVPELVVKHLDDLEETAVLTDSRVGQDSDRACLSERAGTGLQPQESGEPPQRGEYRGYSLQGLRRGAQVADKQPPAGKDSGDCE